MNAVSTQNNDPNQPPKPIQTAAPVISTNGHIDLSQEVLNGKLIPTPKVNLTTPETEVTNIKPKSFEEFWPGYLGAHSKPMTRFLHYLGPPAGVTYSVGCVVLGTPWALLAVPLVSYLPPFLGHWLVEGNHPKTFGNPLWSIMGEFKMIYLGLTGKIGAELKKYKIN